MLDDWRMAAKAEWILADGDEAKQDEKACGKFEREFLMKNKI
jgi:hypothetical protein